MQDICSLNFSFSSEFEHWSSGKCSRVFENPLQEVIQLNGDLYSSQAAQMYICFIYYGASSLLLPTVPSSPENVTLTPSSSRLRVTWTIDPPDGIVSN